MKRMTQEEVAAAAWTHACTLTEHGGDFSVAQLCIAIGRNEKRVRSILKSWIEKGDVEFTRFNKRRKCYRVRTGVRTNARRRSSAHGNMWLTMRKSPRFSALDVQMCAQTADTPVDLNTARKYCQMLVGASYLKVHQKAVPGKREAIYQLIKDTGPKPPRMRRIEGLFDENTGEFHFEGTS